MTEYKTIEKVIEVGNDDVREYRTVDVVVETRESVARRRQEKREAEAKAQESAVASILSIGGVELSERPTCTYQMNFCHVDGMPSGWSVVCGKPYYGPAIEIDGFVYVNYTHPNSNDVGQWYKIPASNWACKS